MYEVPKTLSRLLFPEYSQVKAPFYKIVVLLVKYHNPITIRHLRLIQVKLKEAKLVQLFLLGKVKEIISCRYVL